MIDLIALAAGKYRTTLDESARLDPCRSARTWYVRIPCKHGFISPHGPGLLAAYGTGRAALRLMAIPGVRVHQRGDREARVVFAPDRLEDVATVLKARRRPSLTDAERERRAELLNSLRKGPVFASL